MIEHGIEQIAVDLAEAFDTHNFERTASLCSVDYEGVDVGRATTYRGPVGVRQALEACISAFPDMSFSSKELIADNNRVVQVWTASGTHQGKWMNIPATGRQFSIDGVSVLTVFNGKIAKGLYAIP